ISEEILDILGKYQVRHIELGIQSMDDKVLAACKRGHTAEDTVKACRLIKEAGFELVGHDKKLFADLRLHPRDAGFHEYYENPSKRIGEWISCQSEKNHFASVAEDTFKSREY
ncbi:MAG: radical SAM protein, partial [Clostridia bacterium]|nr:radical SAM protein [Clostridia bacterium]